MDISSSGELNPLPQWHSNSPTTAGSPHLAPRMERYPSAPASAGYALSLADRQRILQSQRFEYLKEALSGTFVILKSQTSETIKSFTFSIQFPLRPDLSPVRVFNPYLLKPKIQDLLVTEWQGLSAAFGFTAEPRQTETLEGKEAVNIAIQSVRTGLELINDDRRFTDGGILYMIGNGDLFWTMMIVWHLRRQTGNSKWDEEVAKLMDDNDAVPCMFFQTPFGCHDPSCPFIHHSAPRTSGSASVGRHRSYSNLTGLPAWHRHPVRPTRSQSNNLGLSLDLSSLPPPPPLRQTQSRSATLEAAELRTDRPRNLKSLIDFAIADVDPNEPPAPLMSSEEISTVPKKQLHLKINTTFSVRPPSPAVNSANTFGIGGDWRKPRPVYHCANCDMAEPAGVKFKVCSRCRKERYCGRVCQEQRWKDGHAKVCVCCDEWILTHGHGIKYR
ncbi:hypothetical protein BJ742DRAFT_134023 [Cladochytrium replicatum]|nr:hypothetical protein BJ742DRAFT_134023 [Cladochytrium replicatum]